ncbi:MucB/RseB C-terminal domain-containing protein [Variovorax sp. PCZ-1]|uniref:MucB/RseB C-terminal domain-containing protein n=1 Tax=Variovorax sp. PCZ-1 TaxID=2835533 RepID=UPI001BCD46F0|nr:MucB/RseB C-terminal domain-containing protein [Variovorax sp. PCZ-1]MBS7808943.1 MucB/RseB C-terminal domain-containing protein [Variovorax sp. PCZ-1]
MMQYLKKNPMLVGYESARNALIFIAMSGCLAAAFAQTQVPVAAPVPTGDGAISVNEWLVRMHEASMKKRSYIGTLVQSSRDGMSSARIWHACDGASQIERIESLTGAPRSSIRKDDKLVTFMPETKLVRMEKREGLGAGASFSDLLKPGANQIPDFYTVKSLGSERIAGLDADVVVLNPRDGLRYGYRIWTERKSALVLKLQTLDASGTIVEQAAFSELQLDAPVKADKLKSMMKPAEGWRVEQADVVKTTASAEGWNLKTPVPGFKSVSCHKRGSAQSGLVSGDGTVQWVFSDGLATVSLFLEAFDKTRHTQEGLASAGATHSLFRRMNEHFLTAVGEVPPQTLRNFAAALERKK